MVLSDKQILEEIQEGNVVIDPFNEANLNTSSYDLRLGEFFYREQRPQRGRSDLFDIYNMEDVRRVWGEPQEAVTAGDWFAGGSLQRLDAGGLRSEDRVIFLRPGETILAHTQEFAGGRNIVTTSMQARSSMGRSFIEVCKCAGWGDVGYINRWTMEITNNSRYETIPLVVGARVSQLVFMYTGDLLGKDYSASGAYQTTSNLEELKLSWKPEMMLPRLRR